MQNCTKRKRVLRVHDILSNGQHFNMYFKKQRSFKNEDRIHGVWVVGLCISDTRKEANLWYNKKWKNKGPTQTGKCGLEALLKAADYLVYFASILSYHSELQVGWQDDKRRRAYRWLTRYGFKVYGDHYSIRNPKYWVMENLEGVHQ